MQPGSDELEGSVQGNQQLDSDSAENASQEESQPGRNELEGSISSRTAIVRKMPARRNCSQAMIVLLTPKRQNRNRERVRSIWQRN